MSKKMEAKRVTAGAFKELAKDHADIAALIKEKADDQELDLIDRYDYFAFKWWDRHDIADALMSLNRDPSKENIEKVFQYGRKEHSWSYLNESPTSEIEIFDEAMEEAMEAGIPKGEEDVAPWYMVPECVSVDNPRVKVKDLKGVAKHFSDVAKLIEGKAEEQCVCLIDKNDYIGIRMWSQKDVADRLSYFGYDPTEENINWAIRYGEPWDYLNDFTDDDIDFFIETVREILDSLDGKTTPKKTQKKEKKKNGVSPEELGKLGIRKEEREIALYLNDHDVYLVAYESDGYYDYTFYEFDLISDIDGGQLSGYADILDLAKDVIEDMYPDEKHIELRDYQKMMEDIEENQYGSVLVKFYERWRKK